MNTQPSIQRIAELQQLIAQFAGVERAYYLPEIGRKDADTDHSYGLALTCWYLQPKIAPELDLLEVFKFALAHDLVELHAGDTFVFDDEGLKGKSKREREAAARLKDDWPDFPGISEYAQGYMDKSTEEAKFVKAVDKILPVLLIDLVGEEEWRRLDVTLEMEREHKVSMHVSEYISPYYEPLLSWLAEQGNIPVDSNKQPNYQHDIAPQPSVQRLAELQTLIGQLAGVERSLYLPTVHRKESDTDHSYGLALTCWFLQPCTAPKLDLLEIFKLALAHDLVEIQAGDTFAYDEVKVIGKENRERAAVTQLRADWPDFSEMPDYAEWYMDAMSKEAKFVKAVDKLLPDLMTELSGKDEWNRLGVTLPMVRRKKVSMKSSPHIAPYYERMLDWLEASGNISGE